MHRMLSVYQRYSRVKLVMFPHLQTVCQWYLMQTLSVSPKEPMDHRRRHFLHIIRMLDMTGTHAARPGQHCSGTVIHPVKLYWNLYTLSKAKYYSSFEVQQSLENLWFNIRCDSGVSWSVFISEIHELQIIFAGVSVASLHLLILDGC